MAIFASTASNSQLVVRSSRPASASPSSTTSAPLHVQIVTAPASRPSSSIAASICRHPSSRDSATFCRRRTTAEVLSKRFSRPMGASVAFPHLHPWTSADIRGHPSRAVLCVVLLRAIRHRDALLLPRTYAAVLPESSCRVLRHSSRNSLLL